MCGRSCLILGSEGTDRKESRRQHGSGKIRTKSQIYSPNYIVGDAIGAGIGKHNLAVGVSAQTDLRPVRTILQNFIVGGCFGFRQLHVEQAGERRRYAEILDSIVND